LEIFVLMSKAARSRAIRLGKSLTVPHQGLAGGVERNCTTSLHRVLVG
jgi:hypothetical protein